MTKRAVVLGGGGPVGIAWESGLIAGLAEQGVNLGEADLFIGTSAGSVVGAQLALGRTPEQLVGRLLGDGERPATQPRPAPGSAPAAPPNLAPLMALMGRLYDPQADAVAVRREIGAFALAATTITEDEFKASFGLWIAGATWPARDYVCTAVDTATGEFRAWDRADGVDLAAAVASSCSVPGIYPPISIDGRRYMDGGMRSATNADLAKGYDSVVVIAVTTGRPPAGAPPAMVGMAERGQQRLEGELDAVWAAGGAVTLIVPDPEAVAIFGPNLMDFTRRAPAAQAGIHQGRAEAARLAVAWS